MIRSRVPAAMTGLALVLAAAVSCGRKPQLVPASADTGNAPPDSFAIAARLASERWDAGEGADAAGATAQLLLRAARQRASKPWVERTHGLLDSLGIAAEIAGGERAMAVNLFSRSNAEGPTWPYLFWFEPDGPRVQSIEGAGLKLILVSTRGFARGLFPGDSAQTAILWGKRVAGGQQPVVMVWRRAAGGRWDLAQTLGADSLGGTGTGEFDSIDSDAELVTRTFRPTPYFDECPTCPHVFHERRFAWAADGFQRLEDRPVPSPYATFTAFIAALVSDDRPRAAELAVDPSLIEFARRLDWQTPARGRWRVAPATDESAITMVFFRGQSDAFRVTFEARDSQFVIAGFEPTARALE